MPRKIKVFETAQSTETSVRLVIKKGDGVETMWFGRKLLMRQGPSWILIPTWFAKKVGLENEEHVPMCMIDSFPDAFPIPAKMDAPKPQISKKPVYAEVVRVEPAQPTLFDVEGKTMALIGSVKHHKKDHAA